MYYLNGLHLLPIFLQTLTLLFLRKNTGLPVVHFTLSGSTGFTLVLSVLQVINIYLFSTHILVFPPIIGGSCMCLSISLLAIKSCYWLPYKGKYNIHFKTFRYCTREIILSWKLFFIMLKINDLVIKLFISLYLVVIYYSCIFI